MPLDFCFDVRPNFASNLRNGLPVHSLQIIWYILGILNYVINLSAELKV